MIGSVFKTNPTRRYSANCQVTNEDFWTKNSLPCLVPVMSVCFVHLILLNIIAKAALLNGLQITNSSPVLLFRASIDA